MHHVDIVGSPTVFQEMQAPIQTAAGALVAIDPLSDRRYEQFVSACDRAGAYHAGAWARILAAAYGARPSYLALEGGDGELQAVLPLMATRGILSGRRLRSLPVTPFAG